MPPKPSHDPSRKANSRLTRQALFHLRLNQLGDRDASTQYISLYTSTLNSESVPSEFSPQDEARILALEREDMASSISSTEVSRQRKIAVRENYTTAAPFGSRIPTHVKPTQKHTEQEQSQTSQTSSSQHSSAMKFHRSAPQPGKIYSKPNPSSFDDSTWRHGAELRRLKEQALEAARFKPETRELFGMNVFSGEPEVDWDEEDNDDAPTATIDSIIPDVYPPHSVVGSAAELGTYLASSNYVISLGGPPLPEMRYGIVIVPINEERLLFPGYGDHAAMPDELKKQIYSKSKAMQHEQVEALRKQAADEVVNPINEGNHPEVSQRKWILPVGSPEFANKGGTWVIRTGPSQPVAYYDHDNCDTSEIDPLDTTKRFTSTPLPKVADQSISESVASGDKPKRLAGTPPLQSSVPDTADYDDKTDYEETEDDKTEQAKTEDTPETKPFDVKIFPLAKSPVQKCEQTKQVSGRRSAPLPISSESDDREWFRDYFRRSLSPDHGMKPSEEDHHQFQLRRRRVLERRGEAFSDSHVEEYSTSKLQHPQPTRNIAQILLPEDKEEITQQKEPSVETSGSQTSGSISCGSSTETDATSNPYPTDPHIADLEKPKVPLQPLRPVQPVRSSQSPRTLQSSQQVQPSRQVESPQPPQTAQPRRSPQPLQQSRPPQPPRTSSPLSVRNLPSDAHDRSIRAKACDTLKHLLRPEKRPATPQVSSMPRKTMKTWSPPPRQTAQARNARMDVTRAITSLANGDPNENPGIDPRVREAAEVGLGYKPSRPLSRTY